MTKILLKEGKFVVLPKGSREGMYIDGLLKANLDSIKEIIRDDWDYIFVCDGEAGAGKSTFIQQVAYYCSDGGLTLEHICFTAEQFKSAILNAKKYDAIIFDEAFRGLSARAAMSALNRSIVEMLNEIRQKNLFVFLLLPSIWDLDSYARLHRCKGCIHVYTAEARKRGYFKFYKNTNYFKKFFSSASNRYMYPKYCDMRGRFVRNYPVDEQSYRAKKLAALNSGPGEKEAVLKPADIRKEYALKVYKNLVSECPSLSHSALSRILVIPRSTLQNWETEVQ